MDLEHTDQLVGFAELDHAGNIAGAVLGPVLRVTAAQYHPDGIGAFGLDMPEAAGIFRLSKPGVRIIDPPHDEVHAVGAQQIPAADT